jgi:hypothetical protein
LLRIAKLLKTAWCCTLLGAARFAPFVRGFAAEVRLFDACFAAGRLFRLDPRFLLPFAILHSSELRRSSYRQLIVTTPI